LLARSETALAIAIAGGDEPTTAALVLAELMMVGDNDGDDDGDDDDNDGDDDGDGDDDDDDGDDDGEDDDDDDDDDAGDSGGGDPLEDDDLTCAHPHSRGS
jgi:hypothetical protein